MYDYGNQNFARSFLYCLYYSVPLYLYRFSHNFSQALSVLPDEGILFYLSSMADLLADTIVLSSRLSILLLCD